MRCSVGGDCSPGRLRRGMCERHYRRVLSSGSTANPRRDNLASYDVLAGGCWRWTGAAWRNGYGKLSVKVHGTRLAHRAFYLEHVGPIADGMDIDHSCHNVDVACPGGSACEHRRCVNPAHLMPAPHADNLARGRERTSLCRNGLHDLTLPGATRPGSRECTECWRTRYQAASVRYRARQRAAG